MDMHIDDVYKIMLELVINSQNWQSKEQDRHIRRDKKRETTEVFQSDMTVTLTSQIEALNEKFEALMQAQNPSKPIFVAETTSKCSQCDAIDHYRN